MAAKRTSTASKQTANEASAQVNGTSQEFAVETTTTVSNLQKESLTMDTNRIALTFAGATAKDFASSVYANSNVAKAKALTTDTNNAILNGIAKIAANPALLSAQQSIYGYETGHTGLYEVLDQIINLALVVDATDAKDVKTAFLDIRKMADDGYGIMNIGKPKLPKIDDEFAAVVKANPCKALVNVIFPNADGSIRGKYTKITKWAKEHNRHNFVEWLENDISYEDATGQVICGKGIKGASKFISLVQKTNVPAPKSDEKPLELAKRIGGNTRFEIPSPSWLDKEINDCLIMASRDDKGLLYLYDVTVTELKQIETAIRNRHASHFSTSVDFEDGNVQKLNELIQNLRKLIAPKELVMSQYKGATFLTPLYPTWVDDNGNPKYSREHHYAIVIDVSGIMLDDMKTVATFPHVNDENVARIDLSYGYSASDIKAMVSHKSGLCVKWTSTYKNSFQSMGTNWETTKGRKYAPGKKDAANDCFRGLSEAPVGSNYITTGLVHGRTELSTDIDFDTARKEFKQWKDLSFKNGLKRDTVVLIVVENGQIGIWFPPIKAAKQPADGTVAYDFDGKYVKVGTTSEKRMRGKWCVPEKKIERIWNFISNPWMLCIPNRLDTIVIGEGDDKQPCLSFDQALAVMDTNKDRANDADTTLNERERADKVYQRLLNLCADQEGEPGWVKENDSYRRAAHDEQGHRLCVPLVLRCGRMHVHLPSNRA